MSTIRALNAGAPGAGTTTELMPSLAKAWANYNNEASSFRASLNIASATNNGTGDDTFNYTSAMANVNYSPCSMTFTTPTSIRGGALSGVRTERIDSPLDPQSSLLVDSMRMATVRASNSGFNAESVTTDGVYFSVLGDLA